MKKKMSNHLMFSLLVFLLCGCTAFVKETKDHPAVWFGERTKIGFDATATDQTGAIKGGITLGYKHERFFRFNPLDKTFEVITGDQLSGTAYNATVGNYIIIRVGYVGQKETDIKDVVEPVIPEPIVLDTVEDPGLAYPMLPEPIISDIFDISEESLLLDGLVPEIPVEDDP